MNLNSITADINFEYSVIKEISLKTTTNEILEDTQKSFGLDIKCSNPINIGERKFGKLLLILNITLNSKESSGDDNIKLVMEGLFSSESTIEDDKFLELLNVNGGAALYSIARAKIESISSLAYDKGKLLIPMINMVQYYQERSKAEKGNNGQN